ncbi:MAG: peptide deformylase [Veillonellaceae bacterium]|nr:peptide deformylase [Veillonellaceae bacterium]MDD6923758.1 peptide deformylase [Veillonellaceae bacterium]
MASLEIKKAGNPVLKEICKPVDRVDSKLRKLLDDMADTLYDANGVGLAAPQVGIPIRVVVIDVGDGLIEMVNPVIRYKEGEQLGAEGCLSVPGIFGDVKRAEVVKVEFTDRKNKRKVLTGSGLLARCIQHELDHLEGRLFIDIAESLRREED